MAQKTSGNVNFPFNFNVQLEGPIDARATVEAYADLASVPQKYDGMIVSVVDDTDSTLVGVYYYLDATDEWLKIGSADDDGGVLEWTVDASSTTSAYVLTGPGTHGSYQDNPNLYMMRGQTYRIRNETGSHPLEIQDEGGTTYTGGVTNNGVTNGVLEITVPLDAPSFLKYQCTSHASMEGSIQVLGTPPGGGAVAQNPSLGELFDVDTTGATNGNVIKYNSGTGNWEPGNDNNTNQLLWRTINADTGSTNASSTADTLTIAGGTDITTTIVGDTVTIDYGGSGGSATKISDGYFEVEANPVAVWDDSTGITGTLDFRVPVQNIVDGNAKAPIATTTAWQLVGPKGNNAETAGGHLIPTINARYDIGSAELKVRHLYLSSNSLWIGDTHKISIDETTEEMQFLKRDKTVLPPKLAERGETIESVKTRFGKATLSDVKLGEWDLLAREQGFKLEEVYDIQEASVWQKQKSLDALEKGDRIERVPQIDVDASARNIDLTDRIANSATGILIIYNSDYEIKLDLGVLTKSVSTEPYEFYSADQGPITIVTGGAQVYSIFDRSNENVIRCESGQFIKFWFNRGQNRFEYIYRSL